MGVDIDKPAVDRGNARDPELKLTFGSFEEFTPPEPPDVLFMFHVLEHIPEQIKLLKEIKKKIKKKEKLL